MYSAFAKVYDHMQYDVDYEFWADQIDAAIKKYHQTTKRVLELACGTGRIAKLLYDKGYIMEGSDISEEMLSTAQESAFEEGKKIKFFCQDMVELNLNRTYDTCVLMCDGLNYVTDNAALRAVFQNVYNHLTDNGLFIFDLSTYYKLSQVIGNHTFAETFEESAYIWDNHFDEETNILEFDLTLFIDEGEGYERYEEFHQQRAYKRHEVEAVIMSHFEILEISDGDAFDTLHDQSQRWCFICRKKST